MHHRTARTLESRIQPVCGWNRLNPGLQNGISGVPFSMPRPRQASHRLKPGLRDGRSGVPGGKPRLRPAFDRLTPGLRDGRSGVPGGKPRPRPAFDRLTPGLRDGISDVPGGMPRPRPACNRLKPGLPLRGRSPMTNLSPVTYLARGDVLGEIASQREREGQPLGVALDTVHQMHPTIGYGASNAPYDWIRCIKCTLRLDTVHQMHPTTATYPLSPVPCPLSPVPYPL